MSGSTPMSVQDALWLTMDRPNNLMVVDGAMLLGGVPDLESVRAVFREAVERFPVLGRRAVRRGGGWGWQDDAAFDLDRHVTRAELPEPQDIPALQRFIAVQRAVPLDRSSPLWCGFLVHPVRLADGAAGSAVVTRFHHSIADGVRLTQVMLSLLRDEQLAPSGRPRVLLEGGRRPSAAPSGGIRRLVEGGLRGTAQLLTAAMTNPVGFVAAVPGTLARQPGRLLDALDVGEILAGRHGRLGNDVSAVAKLAFAGSSPSIWSGTPGPAKAMAWSPQLPLEAIKRAGQSQGATVNDVMLAAVAGGLRRYLAGRGGTVDEVLWMVPVNLKPFADNLPPELGNYFALVWLPMPLGTADPLSRVRQMHRHMERIKRSDEALLTFGLQRMISTAPPPVTVGLTNFFANKAVGVLTNVPGPAGPRSFAGVPVLQIVGFAPCSGDNPMSATIFSYDGGVTVGFSTDAGLIPDPDVLAAHVQDELAAIQAAAAPAPSVPPLSSPRRPVGPRPGSAHPG